MPRLVSDFAGMKATTQLSTDPGHREEKKRKLQRTQRWSQVAKDHPVTGEMNHGWGPQVNRPLGGELLSVLVVYVVRR